MNWTTRKLTVKQIDRQVKHLSDFKIPTAGWIKTIREALGMNARQLGERSGVSGERILKIESDELKSRLTMATLEKMAEAMNCRLVYGFVPSESLSKIIERAAAEKARLQLTRVSHTMALEDQKITDKVLSEQIELLKEDLLRGNIKKVWEK